MLLRVFLNDAGSRAEPAVVDDRFVLGAIAIVAATGRQSQTSIGTTTEGGRSWQATARF
jgi:hypothetical protein